MLCCYGSGYQTQYETFFVKHKKKEIISFIYVVYLKLWSSQDCDDWIGAVLFVSFYDYHNNNIKRTAFIFFSETDEKQFIAKRPLKKFYDSNVIFRLHHIFFDYVFSLPIFSPYFSLDHLAITEQRIVNLCVQRVKYKKFYPI